MRHINPRKAALAVGSVIGLYHLTWTVLVAAGVAQAVLDFVLRLHFIRIEFELAPFALDTAALLVGLTFAIGAAFGFIFALIWNWLTSQNEARGSVEARVSPALADG